MARPLRWLNAALGLLGRERVLIGAILLFAFVARLTFALTVPPWQSPDEPKHFEYVRLVVDKRAQLWAERRRPSHQDISLPLQKEILSSMARHNFWPYLNQKTPEPLPASFFALWNIAGSNLHTFSPYYFIAATLLLPFQNVDLEQQLLIVRLLSVLLSTATVGLAYRAARKFMPGDRFVPAVSAAFVAALPMHVFIGGVANTDNMVTFSGTLFILALTAAFRRGLGRRHLILLLAALALALMSKRTSFGLLAAIGLAAILWLAALRGRRLLLVAAALLASAASGLAAFAWEPASRVLPVAQLHNAVASYALSYPGKRSDSSGQPIARQR